jgi:hypothetical protein
MEEDELSSRSPSPYPSSIKATRRHARITGNDLADLDTAFPSNRLVYPSPSPASSSDSLKLSFTDLLKFPYPPTSYLSSSPHSSGMPITPGSDVDFTLPSPRFRPANPVMLNFSRESIDSDADSDSEWYHNEFSKLIETPYASPQLLPPSRPDSIFISTDDYSLPKRRSITDMVYPCRRNSKSRSIILPSYRPLPPLPQYPPPKALVNISRPPPRSTLPADCVVDLFVDDDERDVDSDSSSSFSFTMYDIDLGDRRLAEYTTRNGQSVPQSPRSTIKSRISFDLEMGQEIEVDLDDARFELDYQLPLPFSIPATPLDLEFDITKSFEGLGDSEHVFNEPKPPKPPYTPAAAKEFPRTPVKAAPPSAYTRDHLTDPTLSPFIFPPSPSPGLSPGLNREEKVLKSKWSSSTIGSVREEHARTKNKQGRTASSKLKLYFGGGSSTPPKTPSKHPKTPSSSTKSISQPSSPLSSTPPRKTKTHSPSLSPSPLPLRWPSTRGHKRKLSAQQSQHTSPTHRPSNSSDVIIIGYGQGAGGLKRRGSSATVSSEGAMSEASTSSSSSIGLRRKPIPIEMFLRNATCPPRYLKPI